MKLLLLKGGSKVSPIYSNHAAQAILILLLRKSSLVTFLESSYIS